MEYDLPLEKKKNSYTCGDGSGDLKIDTTSGDITLLACQDQVQACGAAGRLDAGMRGATGAFHCASPASCRRLLSVGN